MGFQPNSGRTPGSANLGVALAVLAVLLPLLPEAHKCRRLHGHSFQVEVVVEADESFALLEALGMPFSKEGRTPAAATQ